MTKSQGKDRYEIELAQAQLEALKVRMNPHFIANVLTTIRSMIFKDPDAAYDALTAYSTLIRTTLENASKDYITLAAELFYIRNYIDIEELRFTGKFTTRIIFMENLVPINILVPPTIFQPYIENAINHGLMHRSSDGVLIISFKSDGKLLKCSIEDNGVGRQRSRELENPTLTGHTSLSEQITRERLALYNKIYKTSDFAIETTDITDTKGNVNGTKVEIQLPLKYIYNENDLVRS
ncbi:MAG: histidine kinase [Bacteroidota bacterium]